MYVPEVETRMYLTHSVKFNSVVVLAEVFTGMMLYMYVRMQTVQGIR